MSGDIQKKEPEQAKIHSTSVSIRATAT